MLNKIPSVRMNIFPAARSAIRDWDKFSWHSTSAGIDADQTNSSQALAIDLFGTLAVSPDRDAILDEIATLMGLPPGGPWKVCLEWMDESNRLGELRPTQVDAKAEGGHSVILFECKFTEPTGGACSQLIKRKVSGQEQPEAQCSGSYMMQTNPVNGQTARCALTPKGTTYWDVVQEIFDYNASEDILGECPFAGGGYQWMRNLVLAWSYAKEKNLHPGFVLVYADDERLPVAQKVSRNELDECLEHLKRDMVACETASYQEILAVAERTAESKPFAIKALTTWVTGKIEHVAARRAGVPPTYVGLPDLSGDWEMALVALCRGFQSVDAHKAATQAGQVVRKPALTDDRAFEQKYPDHPLAARNRFTRMAAADFFRDVARDQRSPFPQAVLDRLHESLFDCCAAVRLSIAQALYSGGNESSYDHLERLAAQETESPMARKCARVAALQHQAGDRRYPVGSRRILLLTSQVDLAASVLELADEHGLTLVLARPQTPDWMAGTADAVVLDRRLIPASEWKAGVESISAAHPLLLIDADSSGASPADRPLLPELSQSAYRLGDWMDAHLIDTLRKCLNLSSPRR